MKTIHSRVAVAPKGHVLFSIGKTCPFGATATQGRQSASPPQSSDHQSAHHSPATHQQPCVMNRCNAEQGWVLLQLSRSTTRSVPNCSCVGLNDSKMPSLITTSAPPSSRCIGGGGSFMSSGNALSGGTGRFQALHFG